MIWAMTCHQAVIHALFRAPSGMGLDPRTGELVVIVNDVVPATAERSLKGRIEAMTGVPSATWST